MHTGRDKLTLPVQRRLAAILGRCGWGAKKAGNKRWWEPVRALGGHCAPAPSARENPRDSAGLGTRALEGIENGQTNRRPDNGNALTPIGDFSARNAPSALTRRNPGFSAGTAQCPNPMPGYLRRTPDDTGGAGDGGDLAARLGTKKPDCAWREPPPAPPVGDPLLWEMMQ